MPDTHEPDGRFQRPGRSAGFFLVVAAVAAVIALVSHARLAGEREVALTLECVGGRCHVSINQGEPMTFDLALPEGGGVGFYEWKRPAAGEAGTRFLDLRVERLDGSNACPPILLSLREPADLGRFDWMAPGAHATDGDEPGDWHVDAGRGLGSRATRPGMALALLKSFEAGDFRMTARIRSPRDAGFLFRARDLRNGMVLVVRPPCNDLFFFQLEEGVAGPIRELRPFRELRVGFELWRLGGLLSVLVLKALLLIGVFAALSRLADRHRGEEFLGSLRRRIPLACALVGVFAATAAVLAWVATASLDRIPHITDEVAYLFQAKIFAAGRFWAEVPRLPEFFTHYHLMTEGGRWFSKYPPMFSAWLALGVRAGVPWLVNPLLGGALAVALVLLAREIGGSKIAGPAWALAVTSPFFLFMGASLMSHMAAALFLTLCLLWVVRGVRAWQPRHWFLAGLAWAAALCTRPFTAVVVALPLGLYAVQAGWRTRERRLAGRSLVAFLMGAFPLIVLLVAWTILYSSADGRPMIPNVGYHATDGLGFGADRGEGWLMTWGSWGHTPAKAVRSVFAYLDDCVHYLQGWPWGLSLVFAIVPFLLYRRLTSEIRLLLGVFLALVAGHMFYWATQHLGYGARYWFEALPGLFILSAIGIRSLVVDVGSDSATANRPAARRARVGLMGALLGGLVFWNLAVYLPPRLLEGHTYGGATVALAREVEHRGLTNAVILVKTENSVYNDGFHLNDPFLRHGPVFAQDLGTNNAALLTLYPGRPAFVWDKKRLQPIAAPP